MRLLHFAFLILHSLCSFATFAPLCETPRTQSMSKEINDIIKAFKLAQSEGRASALATVVHVEGSSYRRPGARMLIEDNGQLTGAISGGCLEGDALRKALLAINQGRNKLVTYNSMDEDDIEFGVQLGCNGIVHILFEPINAEQDNHPIRLLEKIFLQKKNAVLVTLFSLKNFHGPQPGTCFYFGEEMIHHILEDIQLASKIQEDAGSVLVSRKSIHTTYNDGEWSAFVELVQPPVSLIIAGAGNDAIPLVEMASVLGWPITVVDGRSTHATKQRFSKATSIIVGNPEEVIKQVVTDERSFIVLMTHNYNYDREMMGLMLQQNIRYIGALGPKKRLQRILDELKEKGVDITDVHMKKIHGPVGLDIGAETAEEIALSILAERRGTPLRDKPEYIHVRPEPVLQVTQTDMR